MSFAIVLNPITKAQAEKGTASLTDSESPFEVQSFEQFLDAAKKAVKTSKNIPGLSVDAEFSVIVPGENDDLVFSVSENGTSIVWGDVNMSDKKRTGAAIQARGELFLSLSNKVEVDSCECRFSYKNAAGISFQEISFETKLAIES